MRYRYGPLDPMQRWWAMLLLVLLLLLLTILFNGIDALQACDTTDCTSYVIRAGQVICF